MSTFLIVNRFEDYSYKNSFGLAPEGTFLRHDYHKNSGFIKVDKKTWTSFMGDDLVELINTARVHTFLMDDFDGLVNEDTITQKMNALPNKTITTADTSTEIEYGIVYHVSDGTRKH